MANHEEEMLDLEPGDVIHLPDSNRVLLITSNRNSLKPEFTGSAYNNSHNYWWFSEKEDVYKLFISDYFSCNAKPGPRYQSEGSYSGEWFRKFILDPAFSKAKQDNIRLFVNLDGVVGYSSGFLKECFGELAKAYPKQLSKYLVLECDDKPDLVREIQDMVKDYEPEQKYIPKGISYKVGGSSVAYVDGDILDSGAARRQVRGARELCERSNPNGNGWFSEKRTYTPKKNGKSGEDKKGKSKGKPTGFKPVPDPYERK